jgi:hypothetical protein
VLLCYLCNSGELEFDEFVLILTTKLGVGQQPQSSWQELADGTWALDVGQGGSIGAAALMQGLVSNLDMQLLCRNCLCACHQQPVHVSAVRSGVCALLVMMKEAKAAGRTAASCSVSRTCMRSVNWPVSEWVGEGIHESGLWRTGM